MNISALRTIVLVVSVISFLLAAAGVPSRVAWIPLGAAAFVASFLLTR